MATTKKGDTLQAHERVSRTFAQMRSYDEREEQAGPVECTRRVVVADPHPVVHALNGVEQRLALIHRSFYELDCDFDSAAGIGAGRHEDVPGPEVVQFYRMQELLDFCTDFGAESWDGPSRIQKAGNVCREPGLALRRCDGVQSAEVSQKPMTKWRTPDTYTRTRTRIPRLPPGRNHYWYVGS